MTNQEIDTIKKILFELRTYDEKFIDSLILIIDKTEKNSFIIYQISDFIDKYILKIKDEEYLSKFNTVKEKIDKIKELEKNDLDNYLIYLFDDI